MPQLLLQGPNTAIKPDVRVYSRPDNLCDLNQCPTRPSGLLKFKLPETFGRNSNEKWTHTSHEKPNPGILGIGHRASGQH